LSGYMRFLFSEQFPSIILFVVIVMTAKRF